MIPMGLMRKMASLATLGAVDFRSDKERIARNTAITARQAKKATEEAERHNKAVEALSDAWASRGPGTGDLAAALARLADLHDKGALTDTEFAAAKSLLLGLPGSPDLRS